MGTTLSKETFHQIIPFDYTSSVLFFPIRHHSPVCAIQLMSAMEKYAPDCILVEGPENGNVMIPYITHPETRFPISLYYTYKDKKGELGKENQVYSCYYPMLEYSPEHIALKYGHENNIHTAFIDLSYGQLLLGTKENHGLRRKQEKNTYIDESLISNSEMIEAICEKSGAVNYDDFWEKVFEVNGLALDVSDFVLQFNIHAYMLRCTQSKERLEDEGTLLREYYMAAQVMKHMKQYKRILVVTGAFHTYGLMQLIEKKEKAPKFPKVTKSAESIYIMPYSMQETDALNGYASGMISPGFYQQVWERLIKQDPQAYEHTVLHYILDTAKESKKHKVLITIADESSAFSVAKGLAHLRGKVQCGKSECYEGILSGFIKGELNQSTNLPLEVLVKEMTGTQVGHIPKDAPIPAIVDDFMRLAKKMRLTTDQSIKKQVILSIFSKENHMEISRFFHSLVFLQCEFAVQHKAINLKQENNKNLVRETWEYQFRPNVITRLIENSVYGATVIGASYSLLNKKIQEVTRSEECANLLIDCFLMGIEDQLEVLKKKTIDSIELDSDFFSLSKTLKHLIRLYHIRTLYGMTEHLDYEGLINVCTQKLLRIMILVRNVHEDYENQVIDTLKQIFELSGKNVFKHHRIQIIEECTELSKEQSVNPVILGAIMGILYAVGERDATQVVELFKSYLVEKQKSIDGSRFIRGIFCTARDIIFTNPAFITEISTFLKSIEDDYFIQMLPDFRLAFSYFTPQEIDRIARDVLKSLGSPHKASRQEVIAIECLQYGKVLDAYLVEALKEYSYGR